MYFFSCFLNGKPIFPDWEMWAWYYCGHSQGTQAVTLPTDDFPIRSGKRRPSYPWCHPARPLSWLCDSSWWLVLKERVSPSHLHTCASSSWLMSPAHDDQSPQRDGGLWDRGSRWIHHSSPKGTLRDTVTHCPKLRERKHDGQLAHEWSWRLWRLMTSHISRLSEEL